MPHVASDLHGHTLFSNGRATPEEYVDFRRAIGMRAIAITDRDVLASARRGAAAARRTGILYVAGVEVTAFLDFGRADAEQVDLLAYYPTDVLAGSRLEETFFYRRGARVQEKWRDFVLDWARELHPGEREALDPDGALERLPAPIFPALQTVADRILARAPSQHRAFYERLAAFHEDGELFGWTPEEAIDAIRADGAVDIVAHPGTCRDDARMMRLLDHATGLEVYTPRHAPDLAAHYRVLAEERHKLWTVGADDRQCARYAFPPTAMPAAILERLSRGAPPVAPVEPVVAA